MKLIDYTGKSFGKLLVEKFVGQTKSGAAIWLTECSCGRKKRLLIKHIKARNYKSCGRCKP